MVAVVAVRSKLANLLLLVLCLVALFVCWGFVFCHSSF